MAIDYTQPVGQVRLLVCDVDEGRLVFTNPQIQAFLDLAAGDGIAKVKRAAALAIDTNASNEALSSKVLKSQDLATDGAKVADAMRKHAAALRAEADREETEADEGAFEIVDTLPRRRRGPELTSGWL